jgi:hypothetical protein
VRHVCLRARACVRGVCAGAGSRERAENVLQQRRHNWRRLCDATATATATVTATATPTPTHHRLVRRSPLRSRMLSRRERSARWRQRSLPRRWRRLAADDRPCARQRRHRKARTAQRCLCGRQHGLRDPSPHACAKRDDARTCGFVAAADSCSGGTRRGVAGVVPRVRPPPPAGPACAAQRAEARVEQQ